MIETHHKIYELLRLETTVFNEEEIILEATPNITQTLNELNIPFTSITRNNTLRIDIEAISVRIFETEEKYLKFTEVSNTNVLILNRESSPLSFLNGVTYKNFIPDSDNLFFINSICFFDFIKFLESLDKDTDEAFHFVDYVNKTTRRMVFTSLSDKGRIILRYSPNIPNLDKKTNYSLVTEKFKKCFEEDKLQLPKFLKASLINTCSRFEESSRINMLFENLNQVIDNAKINFEIYINGLSIDKIKKEYDDYKVKYFKEVSDILSNLTTKVVSFPVLTASTLFAVEKLKDYPFFIGLLIITTLIINIYLVILLVVNFKDLNYISSTVENDYNALIENNFFIKFPKEKSVFLRIKQRIISRIQYLRYMCEAYYWIMGVSNGAIIYLMLTYLKLSKPILCIYSLAAFLVLAIARNKILENAEKDIL